MILNLLKFAEIFSKISRTEGIKDNIIGFILTKNIVLYCMYLFFLQYYNKKENLT